MASNIHVLLAISTLSVVAILAEDADVTAPKKKVEELWFFSPLTALLVVKFKLLLLAFLVLTGTASITKFIAGLVHILASNCKTQQPKPVYIKYETPNHGYHHYQYDNSYYADQDFYYDNKKAVERTIRSIEGVEGK